MNSQLFIHNSVNRNICYEKISPQRECFRSQTPLHISIKVFCEKASCECSQTMKNKNSASKYTLFLYITHSFKRKNYSKRHVNKLLCVYLLHALLVTLQPKYGETWMKLLVSTKICIIHRACISYVRICSVEMEHR